MHTVNYVEIKTITVSLYITFIFVPPQSILYMFLNANLHNSSEHIHAARTNLLRSCRLL